MQHCHDCDVPEGRIHNFGCDVEDCPFCGGQLITCDCCYSKLGYNYDEGLLIAGLPKDVYEKGLPKDEEDKWHKILEGKGRIPFIVYPNICAKCGKLWPGMFMVADEEWKRFISPHMRGKMLCLDCYNYIKEIIRKEYRDV